MIIKDNIIPERQYFIELKEVIRRYDQCLLSKYFKNKKVIVIAISNIEILDAKNHGSFNPRPSYCDQYLSEIAERGINTNFCNSKFARINEITLTALNDRVLKLSFTIKKRIPLSKK